MKKEHLVEGLFLLSTYEMPNKSVRQFKMSGCCFKTQIVYVLFELTNTKFMN